MTKQDFCAAFHVAVDALDDDGRVTPDLIEHAMDRQNAGGNPGEVADLAGMILMFGEALLSKARAKAQ